jgi:hypothetical protein
MSQPRRRRRRRRRGPTPSPDGESQQTPEPQGGATKGVRSGRARRRRSRRGGGARKPATPQTLEDVVRDINGGRPESLTAPPDGQKLESVIGELQSAWGVPQYPQEYRITIKVAEERGGGVEREVREGPNGVTRERAPAAPRVAPAPSGDTGMRRERAPRRRRRTRRGRRKGGDTG